jgi:hypothetical protein
VKTGNALIAEISKSHLLALPVGHDLTQNVLLLPVRFGLLFRQRNAKYLVGSQEEDLAILPFATAKTDEPIVAGPSPNRDSIRTFPRFQKAHPTPTPCSRVTLRLEYSHLKKLAQSTDHELKTPERPDWVELIGSIPSLPPQGTELWGSLSRWTMEKSREAVLQFLHSSNPEIDSLTLFPPWDLIKTQVIGSVFSGRGRDGSRGCAHSTGLQRPIGAVAPITRGPNCAQIEIYTQVPGEPAS